MIPSNITREHCTQAAKVADIESVPKNHQPTKFEVVINGKPYPPKWIIHIANEFANGERHSTRLFSGGNEANSFLSERGFHVRSKETGEARDFLFRWLPENVVVGQPLNFAASNQFGKLEVGDRVWIVTSKGRQLFLVGVLPVDSVGDREHARTQLGYTPGWDASSYVIGPKPREALKVEIDISDIADQLRFVSDTSNRLDLHRDIGQQLKTMRQLTYSSAERLGQALDFRDFAGTSGKNPSGAGFGDPETNRKVEKAAIDHVTRHFESLGYVVRSKELERIGYDLLCVSETGELHVEVKGVQADTPIFMVTSNEKLQAEEDPDWNLAIVTCALTTPTIHQIAGRTFLQEYSFKALQFRAEPKQD